MGTNTESGTGYWPELRKLGLSGHIRKCDECGDWLPVETPCVDHGLARRPSPGTLPEPSDTAASRPYPPPADIDGQLRQLAALDAQRLAALEDLARIHRDRVAVIQDMRVTMGPGRIAELLGVSRQQVHKLFRGE